MTLETKLRLHCIFWWILTVVSLLLALFVLMTLYYMLHPVDFNGIGKIGFFALLFTPQLLVITLVALMLGFFAWCYKARFAAGIFGFIVTLTTLMALLPTISEYRRAKQYDVPISISSLIIPQINQGGPQIDKTVTYNKAADGTSLGLDVWPAEGVPLGKKRPAIVLIHGGGWVHGSRGGFPKWNKWLTELGYEVFDIEYRMPPPLRWRDEVGDVKCAIGWVVANAAKYKIDTQRISLMGYSAGGNLAMLAAYSMGDPHLPPSCQAAPVKIRSVINFYGPTDIALGYSTSGSKAYIRPMTEHYIGGPPSPLADRYKMLSPINHINAHTPVTITLQGEADRVVPVEQALILDKALSAAGIYHETYIFPWSDHGFDVNWGSFATQVSRAKIKAFLDKFKN